MATVWKFNDGTEHFLTDEQEKIWRKILKKDYKRTHHGGKDRLAKSAMDGTRIYYDEGDGEYWTEYGFLHGTDYSDDEVREIIDDMRYRIYSPYDCTGKPFTMWIDWHRNPTGLISYVHRVGLDV